MDKFVQLYREARLDDQRSFYRARCHEYRQALQQARMVSTVLLAGVVVAASLESFPLPPWLSTLASMIAVVCPLLVSALEGYCSLQAFEPQAHLYLEAIDQLDLLALQPNDGLVEAVEAVLATEQGQWPENMSTNETRAHKVAHA